MVVRSKKRTVFRLLLITIPVLFIWISCAIWFQDRLLDLQDQQLESSAVSANSKQPRKNIIIVAYGRSGSTITGDMFNHHPSVFYLHEPLQTVERLSHPQLKTTDRYGSLMADVLTNIFRCNFSKSVVEDFEHFYRKPNHPRASHAIGSPPLCPYEMDDPKWDPSLCPPMTSKSLGNVCHNNYEISVAKVLTSRIPGGSIKNILAACTDTTEVDCKFIYLIRDPRAVIPSARSVAFFHDPASDMGRTNFRQFSYEICKQTEENLALVKSLPLRWRNRIMIQRYEDFAMNPMDGLSRLFKFAGLSVPESVRTWLNKTTHPSGNHHELRAACKGYHPAFCTVDDASVAVNRWRWKVPLCDIDIIEHFCKHVMWMMGYIPVDRSYELMSDISVPLFSEQYEAKGWLQD